MRIEIGSRIHLGWCQLSTGSTRASWCLAFYGMGVIIALFILHFVQGLELE